jgi:ABC-type transporter Mla MlaB component
MDGVAGTIVLALSGVVARQEIAAMCERLRSRLAAGDAASGVVICDVGRLTRTDVVAVEALARLQLTARRLGCHIQLRHATTELRALITLMGLARVLPLEPLPLVQPERQPEEREQPRGVEEEGDAADPAVL